MKVENERAALLDVEQRLRDGQNRLEAVIRSEKVRGCWLACIRVGFIIVTRQQHSSLRWRVCVALKWLLILTCLCGCDVIAMPLYPRDRM